MLKINEIYKMDCLDFLKEINDKSIDLIFADPFYYPENQKTKNAFQDDAYWKITEAWLKEFKRVIKPTGHIFVSFSSQKMAKFEFLLSELQIPLKSRVVWHYRNAGGRCADKGQFGKTYEMVYHFGYGDTLNFPEQWGEERFDVWTIAIPQSNFKDKKEHPFQKPKELLNRIISIGSREGDLVLDCFMGSGTTAVVCKELGRDYIGCDTDEETLKIANNRISNTQKQSQIQFVKDKLNEKESK